jgi:hypothetical protein
VKSVRRWPYEWLLRLRLTTMNAWTHLKDNLAFWSHAKAITYRPLVLHHHRRETLRSGTTTPSSQSSNSMDAVPDFRLHSCEQLVDKSQTPLQCWAKLVYDSFREAHYGFRFFSNVVHLRGASVSHLLRVPTGWSNGENVNKCARSNWVRHSLVCRSGNPSLGICHTANRGTMRLREAQ